jgi:nitrile hydratase subunit alpha
MPLCGAALGWLAFPHLFDDLRTRIHTARVPGHHHRLLGNPRALVSSEDFAYSPLMSEHHHDHDHSDLSETELRVRAIETILTEKGYVDPAALDLLIETYETKVGPRNGARVVARAWTDPAFRARLIRDATPAIAELGFAGRQGEHIVALENTPRLHNMVVCTLCSCYPWPVLGLPPVWYKSAPYRSKAVKDPRGVLRDFGFELPDGTDIRVWDSTAEIRYLVLPMCPAGTDGWSEERLAELVTRDSMIGTGLPKQPHEVA